MRSLAALCLAGALLAPVARAVEASCTDGLDDDADGAADCADTDCWLDAACEQSVTRTFTVVRDVPNDPNTKWLNIYLVSWPEIPNIADIGNTGVGGPKGCVGDAGGPAAGDGIINSLDALCTIWVSMPARPNGALVLSRFDQGLCQFQGTSISQGPFGIGASGIIFPVVPHEGYYLLTSSNAPTAPSYTVTLRGWRDAAWRGDSVALPAPLCRPTMRILPVPYDTLATKVDEILCGEEGTDWVDANADGNPDTCPNGLFDGTTPISVGTFDNDPGAGPTGTPSSDNWFAFRTVLRTDLGLAFLGPQIAVMPGDAFLVQLHDTQLDTSWIDPRR